jgi:4-alpha-glucanotransferase
MRAMSDRSAGLLLHPTSLPTKTGIGDLGAGAETFLDWAADAGQRLWQVMPLGPTGWFNSPYGCLSAFAGNPMLISPGRLVAEGLLPAAALESAPGAEGGPVDFGAVVPWKENLLRAAWRKACASGGARLREDLEAFAASSAQRYWLDDWCLFAALERKHPGTDWTAWGDELVARVPSALDAARAELADEIEYQKWLQLVFFRQWESVKAEANRRGIQIMGDVPIYVAFGSADVWAHRRLFTVDEHGRAETVAGVPPDYFSSTGQLWGNPLFRWDVMEAESFDWWIERLRLNFRLADVVRIDHFRGFAGYWEVKAGEPTALNGRWVTGPGVKLFVAIRHALGDLPIVAEDLGEITPDVKALLREVNYPGMKVLQFAFHEIDGEYLPHRHIPNCIVYTGTHDNDTTRGWWQAAGEEERRRVRDYFGTDGNDIEWVLIRAAYASVARRAIVPMQDVLGLGSEARMNMPGRAHDNWAWRAPADAFRPELSGRLRRLAELTGRSKPR